MLDEETQAYEVRQRVRTSMLDRDNVKGQEVKAVERIQKNISDKTMVIACTRVRHL